jgi:hypothetical protein
MVWIHGGAFIAGESNDYNPAGLVRHGVIVITINYRLGALGFLAHPALASHPGGSSGDYGLMDQQAALRWVQANIGQFGGNPRNVTLSGESSGGLSVLRPRPVLPGHRGKRHLRPDPGHAGHRRDRGPGLRRQGRLRQPERGLPACPAGLDHRGQRGLRRLQARHRRHGTDPVDRTRLWPAASSTACR